MLIISVILEKYNLSRIQEVTENLMFRESLFQESIKINRINNFHNKRIILIDLSIDVDDKLQLSKQWQFLFPEKDEISIASIIKRRIKSVVK